MSSVSELYSTISKEIAEQGYAQIPAPVLRKQLVVAARSFTEDFLNLSQTLRDEIHGVVDPNIEGTEIGYIKSTKDNKQYFHYNEYVKERLGKFRSYPKVATFFDQADYVYFAAEMRAKSVLAAVNTKFPGTYNRFFQDGVHPNLFLRFLAYDKSPEGVFLAKAHYDRGMFTMALGESHPGLRIGTKEHLTPVPYHPDQALFFKGLQNFSDIDFEMNPAWHDVVQTGQNFNQNIARWSVVMFMDPIERDNVITRDQVLTPVL